MIAVAVLALLGGGWLAVSVGRSIASRAPAANSKNLAAVANYIATDQFDTLSVNQRQAYFDRWDQLDRDERRALESKMSEDDRRALHENLRNIEEDKRDIAYLALPPGPERKAFLDKMMREMWGRRRATTGPTTWPTTMPTTQQFGGGGGGGGPGGPGGRGQGNPMDGQRRRNQSGDQAMKAVRTQVRADAAAQRVASGQPLFPGRGR
jgi:hypothetical protein